MAFSKIFTKLMIAKSGSRGVQTRLLLKRFDNQQRFYAVICCTHIKRSPVLDQQRKKWVPKKETANFMDVTYIYKYIYQGQHNVPKKETANFMDVTYIYKYIYQGQHNDTWNTSYKNMSSGGEKKQLVAVSESRRFMIDCFKAVNVPQDHAEQMADLLVAADYRGHFSHGMNRLEMYLNDLAINSTDGSAVPKILKETPSTAWVDGCNGLGAVVGNFCMDLAIKKAKQVGVGWVCAKGSNHYGIAGWYPMRAMKEGLVGMSMTNTSPLMAPTRSKEAALGTNPLSLGVPAKDDKFLLDMATTAVAVGKIEIQRRKGAPLPDGWAQDPEGRVTNDAELAFQTGCLMPLGGPEINSGYKGYGLGGLVDILSGVMAGANYSTKVRKWTHTGANTAADLGQVFIAVDPNCFAPDFEERMCDFNSRLRSCTPTDPEKPVLVAGDKETINMKAVDEAGGIEYLPNQLKTCESLSQRFNVNPIRFI